MTLRLKNLTYVGVLDGAAFRLGALSDVKLPPDAKEFMMRVARVHQYRHKITGQLANMRFYGKPRVGRAWKLSLHDTDGECLETGDVGYVPYRAWGESLAEQFMTEA